MSKVIISCALTGAVTTKKHCPAIPYTPVEIADEAKRAYDAGAAVVHIHAREDNGMPTWSVDTFRAIKTETEKRCPVLINFSTGGAGPMENRVQHVLQLRPHIAALNMGSMNYAKWRPEKKEFAFNFVFANSFHDIMAFATAMKEAGAKPELECFDTGHTASHEVLVDMGLLRPPYHFSFIMGVLGGIKASARHLAFQASQVPEGGRWKVIGISRDQWSLLMAALSLGGDVRVGLEDNFYLPSGEMAKSNGDLVTKAVELCKIAGREPATPEEAKQLLGIPVMPTMRERVAALEAERARIKLMGGADKIEKQHARSKLTARERLDRFFDGGEYFEIGIHGTQMGQADANDKPPADAVICAYGKVSGRMVCAAAYDFTVKGGSIGVIGETKVTRLRELALRSRMPMVWFIDSGGARIDPKAGGADFISTFAGSGHLFREEVIMSGVVPLVAAMVGPGAAGTAYIPGLADFVPMVKDNGSMALGGPPLVKAVTGQEIGEQELGGSKVHCEKSGVGDVEVPDEAACLQVIKDYLSYLPQHCEERPPITTTADPIDRREERLLDLLPESTRQSYDMYELIKLVVDDGRHLDIKPKWARNIITCFSRIGGYPVGIVANNPKMLGGILDVNASDKAAHFMQICDAFGVPLVFFMDVPGFMVGSKVEHEGIIRHGAKMLHVMAAATVPKLTVVVRKGYGAGYYVMAGRAYEPDLLVAWPGAEISVMGAEGMVGIAGKKLFAGAEPPPEIKAQITAMIQQQIDITKVAGWGLVDDVIDPRDTRKVLARGLEMAWGRKLDRPWRKRGIIPV